MRLLVSITCAAALVCGLPQPGMAQPFPHADTLFTHADTLRGTITPERAWWDVTFYDLNIRVNPADSSINGWNRITYTVIAPAREMQIDLMKPMEIDSIIQDHTTLRYRRDGNAFFVTMTAPQPKGRQKTIAVYYHGMPRLARHAPWDGGFVWEKDPDGNLWMSTAVQGLGASAWWPNKDTQAEEPDSQRITVTVPDPMIDVSNGRLRATRTNSDHTTTYSWFVRNPINNYDVSLNMGTYAHYSDTYKGEKGTLTLDFWPLRANLDQAKSQFTQVVPVLQCFEHWFGPYPWYSDGYKLVETPFLGMEHQSAVAYGNHYHNGYLGRDLSNTNLGLAWDYIIVHESAHEWFGNNITTNDVADMWVHEAFAAYAEGLYTECQSGKAAGATYVVGTRNMVQNDSPIIGPYGVHREGSGDMYFKGANMLHTIRQLVNDDTRWRQMLRGLNATFWHKTVTGQEVQAYMSAKVGMNLEKIFAQYLTTTNIPTLEYTLDGATLSYRWSNVVSGFDMPVKVTLADSQFTLIRPTQRWQSVPTHLTSADQFRVDKNFYVTARKTAEK